MNELNRMEFFDEVFVRRPFYKTSAYDIARLQEVLNDPYFRNALWLASPEFYQALVKKNFCLETLDKRERLTALKFYNRMSFRATPFGAFAAFGLAAWQKKEDQKKQEKPSYHLHLLPSVEAELRNMDELGPGDGLMIAVNPTLYRMLSGWRYSKYEVDKHRKLSFSVCFLEYDEVNGLLLNKLADKAFSRLQLVDFIRELTDCAQVEANDHLLSLLDEQVLISDREFSPLICADAERVSLKYDVHLDLPEHLIAAKAPRDQPLNGADYYAGLEVSVLNGPDVSLQEQIRKALEVLDRLSVVRGKSPMDDFSNAFEDKFGTRRVPLLQALDPDLGISYDGLQQPDEHTLIQGLAFELPNRRTDQLTWTPVHRLLIRRWLQNGHRQPFDPVVIKSADLEDLKIAEQPMPPSTSVLCSQVGDKLLLHIAGGVSATALTGRFNVFSEAFERFGDRIASQEQSGNPDIIFAEILQVSHRKFDNINRRRRIYKKVIPLNVFPPGDSLMLQNLEVSVQNKEVILTDCVSGKRVIPRLPTAFNYHHNEMPLFRFLCDLQYQSVRGGLDFDPEKFFPGLNFYPRVEYGNIVLSLARWHLSREDLNYLTRQPLSLSRLHLFCRERGMPVKISAGRGDQQLVFDFSKDEEALFFLESLHDSANSVITEYLDAGEMPRVNATDGHSQLVVSLYNPHAVYKPASEISSDTQVTRDFPPGSPWIYAKIYATEQTAQKVLLDELLPWLAQRKEQIRQWFFVRYHDPKSHLRFRVRARPADVGELSVELGMLLNGMLTAGLIKKIHFDTYGREIERYGAELIGRVEDVFHRGSENVVRYLSGKFEERQSDQEVWPVLHAYTLISIFYSADMENIIRLCRWASSGFLTEHGGDKKLKRSMDDRFRELRVSLTAMIVTSAQGRFVLPELETAVKDLAACSDGYGEARRMRLIADLIHMQVNRIFMSDQRKQETFIWHCLLKLFTTEIKKAAERQESISGGYR